MSYARIAVIAAVLVAVAGASLAIAPAGRPSAPPPDPVANHAFPSAASPRAPATVWAVGDGADGGAAAYALARRIAAARPERMLYLGDVYEHGSAGDFLSHYVPVYRALDRRTAPTPGNHEWAAHKRGYDPFWAAITGAQTPPWYRLRIGGWTLLSLNSEAPHGPGSAQLAWVRAQTRQPGTCRLAFWHRPRFSAGIPQGDQPDIAPLWNAVRGRAALVLNGHEHDLQRLHAIGGTTELIDGAGGKDHAALKRGHPRLAFGDDTHNAALRIRLSPGRAQLTFIDTAGRVLDHSTVRCAAR